MAAMPASGRTGPRTCYAAPRVEIAFHFRPLGPGPVVNAPVVTTRLADLAPGERAVVHAVDPACPLGRRLLDLGFPPWEEALGIYALLPDTELDAVSDQAEGLAAAAFRLPIWPPRLPATPDARHALFRAAARLDEDERRALLYALLAAANAVAVLDALPLGDPESVPRAIERVAVLASAGLEHLAEVHALDAVEVLRRVPLQRLVRVGRTLDVRTRADAALSDGEREERT